MVNVEARLKSKGKSFEILVDLEKAVAFKKSSIGDIENILAIDIIFSDAKKGEKASSKDLIAVFGTDDVKEVAKRIIKEGEIQLTEEFRKKEREAKIKQIVDFISKNAIDPNTGLPHPAMRIERALEQAKINIKDIPIEQQIGEIVSALTKVLPIKISSKRISVIVPAQYTGKVMGLIQKYKEKEEWKDDGSYYCIVNIPSGIQNEFYSQLNRLTNGSVLTREEKE